MLGINVDNAQIPQQRLATK